MPSKDKVTATEHKRMLSPSQINTFLNCRRSWYYQYVLKIEVPENFAQVRGNVVHDVVEEIFKWRPAPANTFQGLVSEMQDRCLELLERFWKEKQVTERFGADKLEETREMVRRFVKLHEWKMVSIMDRYGDTSKAWNFTKPKATEMHIIDQGLGVQGYIDAVIDLGEDGIVLLDYKTSKFFKHNVSEEYQRQMYIYALMYERKTGEIPAYVALEYLLYGQVVNYPIRRQFLEEAEDLINFVHVNTESNDIKDYPCSKGYRFCDWCDFKAKCNEDGAGG